MPFDRIEDAIEAMAQGSMVLVVDDEDRENEGDIILAAEHATTESIAFMVRHTSGMLCVALPGEELDRLELPLMVERNTDSLRTAYTVTVDYRHGTSTGISAADRAATIRALVDPAVTPSDFNRPGHVFPLRAVRGGSCIVQATRRRQWIWLNLPGCGQGVCLPKSSMTTVRWRAARTSRPSLADMACPSFQLPI